MDNTLTTGQITESFWYKNKHYRCLFKLSKTDTDHAYAILFDMIYKDGKIMTINASRKLASDKVFISTLQIKINETLKVKKDENKE